MFHSSNLPALIRHQCITPEGAYPRFLTAIKRTHTSIYVLKLSSDPPITAVPGLPGERLLPALYCPSDPYAISGALRLTRQFESISAAHTHSIPHAVLFPNVPNGGFSPTSQWSGLIRVTAAPVSVSPNIFLDWVEKRLSPPSARCSRTSQY